MYVYYNHIIPSSTITNKTRVGDINDYIVILRLSDNNALYRLHHEYDTNFIILVDQITFFTFFLFLNDSEFMTSE